MSKRVFLFMNHFNKKNYKKHNLYYKRIFRCIRGPAKSQMTFDLQTILVQDQSFHLCNYAQEVIQMLALKCVQLTISLLGTGVTQSV
jgi:hypothetical protein